MAGIRILAKGRLFKNREIEPCHRHDMTYPYVKIRESVLFRCYGAATNFSQGQITNLGSRRELLFLFERYRQIWYTNLGSSISLTFRSYRTDMKRMNMGNSMPLQHSSNGGSIKYPQHSYRISIWRPSSTLVHWWSVREVERFCTLCSKKCHIRIQKERLGFTLFKSQLDIFLVQWHGYDICHSNSYSLTTNNVISISIVEQRHNVLQC